MPDDGRWDALGKFFDLMKLVLIVGLLVAVGWGVLNADALLRVLGQTIDLLKAAR